MGSLVLGKKHAKLGDAMLDNKLALKWTIR